MRARRGLRARLATSHLVVVVAGAVSVAAVAVVVSPAFLRSHIEGMEQMVLSDMEQMGAELERAFRVASWQILGVALVVSVVVAVLAAFFASRRLLDPITAVQVAARRLAAGHYDERLALPDDEELAALAADINRLAEALESTERSRMRLLNDVAHELRTPLSTIEGYMEAILDGVLEPTPDIIASVGAEALRLKRLASDVSVLSRAEEGVLPLERSLLDLGVLVTDVVGRLGPQFTENDVRMSAVPGPTVLVDADPDRVTQVLTNLIGNALSHTPPGGTVTVSWAASGDEVGVEVTDTGSGIPADHLERIFERFFRGNTSAPGGTGVGLTIARSIARLHGGDVTATSPGPGEGSTFRLTLPLPSPDDA